MFDPSLLQDFITESEEHLEEMENNLLQLESDIGNREILNDIFRCIHTIKGASEFVGLEKISDFTHRLENLLDILRQGTGDLTPEIVDLFMVAKDRITQLIKDLEVHASEETPIDDLCHQVEDWIVKIRPDQAPTAAPVPSEDSQELNTDCLDTAEPAAPELLGDMEITGGFDATGAIHSEPAQASAVIPELEPVEFSEEENDRELFDIFLQQVKEKIEEIITAAEDFGREDTLKVYDRVDHALGSLKSSANYMGYEKLKRFLDSWVSLIAAARGKAQHSETVSSDFMRPYLERIMAHFPQIKFEVPETLQAMAPAEEKPATDGGSFTEEVLDGMTQGDSDADGSEEGSLLAKLDRAFDIFDEPSSQGHDDMNVFESELLGPAGEASPVAPSPVPDRNIAQDVDPTDSSALNPDTGLTEATVSPVTGAAAAGSVKSDAATPAAAPDPAGGKDAQTPPSRPEPSLAEQHAETDFASTKGVKKTMRVDTEKIDALMNQVGELVVSRSWFSQLVSEMRELHQELKETVGLDQREVKQVKGLALKINEATAVLGRVVNDLQDGVMKIRMLPISQLFNRYPRLVRDLVQNTGKKVRLELKGESTELDKMIIEQMSDPLIHIIRNAVDHGIETVVERKRLGKPEEGTLQLVAYHESNHVVIEIVDDGRGIDPEMVKAAAIQKDFLPRDELERMASKELIGLIMRPGFSTAAEITHTSGRGVGMDVVKKNIEKLNGTIEIDSKVGVETRFKIKIPLTLAIISALLVHVGPKSFAIPLSAVEETLRIVRDQISTVEGFEVIHLRNRTLPLLQLSEMFDAETSTRPDQKAYVVIVSTGMRRVGLLVDTLIGQEEVVIKPLADYIQEDSAFSGATILGDGKISLIIDVDGLVNLAVRKHTMIRAEALSYELPDPGAAKLPDRPTPEMTIH